MNSQSILAFILTFFLINCSLYFPKFSDSYQSEGSSTYKTSHNSEEYTFTLLNPPLETTQSDSLKEFLHKYLHSPMEGILREWKKENLHFRYFPVWADIIGVDHEFSYSKWNKNNIIEVTLRHNYIVGTLNSFLHLFSLGILPGLQDNTWYVELKIYDSQGKVHSPDTDFYKVSEIRSSLFLPIWLTGYKSDYKPIMQEIIKNSLANGRAYIQENNIPFQANYNSQTNSYPVLNSPISIRNTELECNVHLQERGTPNVISYHPPAGHGGLCKWSVVFYNHTEDEIELNAEKFRLILEGKKEIKPLSEIFVRATFYNQGASTTNNGIRKLDPRIRIPSYSKGMESASLGIAYPFTRYTFYFPYREQEMILSMESEYKNKPIGIRFK